jgi:hypothetical protein
LRKSFDNHFTATQDSPSTDASALMNLISQFRTSLVVHRALEADVRARKGEMHETPFSLLLPQTDDTSPH